MKNCTQCKSPFEVTDEDRVFYDRVSPIFNGQKYLIPEPTQCPDCRYQNRLILRNERKFYRRKCDATAEAIISIFSPEKNYPPVYSQKYWWSDAWDPMDYGRDFDFGRSFFEQFRELYNQVPQLALNNVKSENSEFTNQSEENKNCYLLVSSCYCENCYYSMWLQNSNNSVDCLYLSKSELCYEVVNAERSYQCTFSENLINSSDCHFSYDLIGCSHCIGCSNLSNKQYHIFNEAYTPEDYKKTVETLNLNTFSGITEMLKKSKALSLKTPKKNFLGSKIEDASGDYLNEVKNAFHSYNCRYGERFKYCQDSWKARNCYDLTENLENDFCYSLEGSSSNVNCLFSAKIIEVSNTIYSSHCFYSDHLFACVGLRNKEYCIFNKQYSKEDYEILVAKIIDYMKQTGEWGEHFPPSLSHFGYNETVAQEYFPLSKEDVLQKGWEWFEERQIPLTSQKKILAQQLPESIGEVPDDILNWAIECQVTGRPYKIIPQELAFYRQYNLPIPRLHPDQRHQSRMNSRNPRKLWSRQCAKCQTLIQTTYSPERPETVYCEQCYLKEIY